MKVSIILGIVLSFLIGCGAASTSTSTSNPAPGQPAPTPPAIQAGQWEFTLEPHILGTPPNQIGNGNPTYLETNLSVSGDNISSDSANTLFYLGGTTSLSGFTLNGTITSPTGSPIALSAKASQPNGNLDTSFDGVLNSAGTFVGTYTNSTNGTGAFSANLTSPFNGSYSGALTGPGLAQTDLALSIAGSVANPTISGVLTQPGNVLSLSVASTGGCTFTFTNTIVGSTINACGTASNSLNGGQSFYILARNDAAGQITIEFLGTVANNALSSSWGTGTLLKQ